MPRLAMALGLLCLITGTTTACFPGPRLFVGVATDKSVYRSGETAGLALTLATQTQSPETLHFSNAKLYDFYLYPESSPKHAAWTWSQGRMYAQVLTRLALEPGQPVTYVVKTDFQLPAGGYPKPGRYRLQAALNVRGKPLLSEPVSIEIR